MEVPVNFYRSYGEQHKTCSMLVKVVNTVLEAVLVWFRTKKFRHMVTCNRWSKKWNTKSRIEDFYSSWQECRSKQFDSERYKFLCCILVYSFATLTSYKNNLPTHVIHL